MKPSPVLEEARVVETAAQPIAYVHLIVPRSQIQAVMGPGIGEVMSVLAAQGVAPSGPWFTHHLRMSPKVFDFEICVPVASAVTPSGRVKAGELPARRVMRTVYRGPYEGLGAAWGAFDTTIAAEGHRTAGDLIEVYLRGPESGGDPSTYETELRRPLAD